MVTFGRHGTGSAQAAIDYLLGDRDAAGIERSHVQVLRGDPQLVADLADSRDQVWRYSAGVIAWHHTDQPTPEQIQAVVDDFEAFTSAGLSEPMTWTVVQHGTPEDPHGVHVHFLIARYDTGSGKAWNPAPPGWQGDYGPWQDLWNAQQGWADPRSPEHARTVQLPASAHRVAAAAARAGREPVIDLREQITSDMTDLIAAGHITSRDALASELQAAGWVLHRQADRYLSIRAPGDGKSIRLKGGIYDRDFWTTTNHDGGQVGADGRGPARPDPAAGISGHGAAGAGTGRADAGLRRQVDGSRDRRHAFHQARFPRRTPPDPHPGPRRPGIDPDHQQADGGRGQDQRPDGMAAHPVDLPAADRRESAVRLVEDDHRQPDPDHGPDRDHQRPDLPSPDRTELDHLHLRRPTAAVSTDQGEVTHAADRDRPAAHRVLAALDRALDRADRAHRALDRAAQRATRLGPASRALTRASALLDRTLERLTRATHTRRSLHTDTPGYGTARTWATPTPPAQGRDGPGISR